ncbi:hypothetical protein PRUPE_3G032400 [Prunus persica]|uniref:Uncharacterized protein n=1 Tax=Prunus persica TaxID=3760 RepID=M5XH61_PRUPE|nr:hypothetical protein PRUPE_3G032400 [Prunus persica]
MQVAWNWLWPPGFMVCHMPQPCEECFCMSATCSLSHERLNFESIRQTRGGRLMDLCVICLHTYIYIYIYIYIASPAKK